MPSISPTLKYQHQPDGPGPISKSSIVVPMVIGVFGVLAGIAVLYLLFSLYVSSADDEANAGAKAVQHNFDSPKFDRKAPGAQTISVEHTTDGEEGITYEIPIPADSEGDGDKTFDLANAAQMNELKKLKHGPLFEIQLQIDSDTTPMSEDERKRAEVAGVIYDSTALNLKREWFMGERVPLAGGDPQKGPFYQPIQMATPRIAFEQLCRDVAAASDNAIAEASNGDVYFYGAYVNIVPRYRGRVFGLEHARLWMLREQPLRSPLNIDGKSVESLYYGVAVILRKGIEGEEPWVNEAVSFTTLTLPKQLGGYVLKADAHPSNDDKLAQEGVYIDLRGAYFRRIMYREPLDPKRAAFNKPSNFEEQLYTSSTYWTEDYVPWLVCRGVELSTRQELPLDERYQIVSTYDETRIDGATSKRDVFDEAGYYMLLDHAITPGAPPLNGVKEPIDLTLRKLQDVEHRDNYRGARMKVHGTLQAEYHLLLLPPNVSGQRYVYRSYVLDALKKADESTDLQWYADTIEAPTNLRGKARVTVNGYYYRSQNFEGVNNKTGKRGRFTFPLLIAPKLVEYQSGAHAGEVAAIDWLTVAVTAGVVLSIIVILILIGRSDRKNRERFERETIASVRGKLAKTRERIAREGAKGKTGHPSTDPKQGDQS